MPHPNRPPAARMSSDPESIRFTPARTAAQFSQMLQLQRDNLSSTLSADVQAREGFVFVEHTLPLLQAMAAQLPQVVALHGERVVGYSLAMNEAMKADIPSLAPMFDELRRCEYRGRPLADWPFMAGGQVCVDRAYRGRGLIGQLYRATRDHLPPGYRLCVTEVATRNEVSLRAHARIGFETVSSYHDGREHWQVVVWNMAESLTR